MNTDCNSSKKIDKKWVKQEERSFCLYPKFYLSNSSVDKSIWLEIVHYIIEDLRWLLSLEHHKFWSYIIYSPEPCQLLKSILRESPPHYLNDFASDSEISDAVCEIEHLTLLMFVRLSTRKESEDCFINNLGVLLYENYIFTVPIMLDICLFYGHNNFHLVQRIIRQVMELAPNFFNDFQEIVPHFFSVLKIMKGKFLKNMTTKVVGCKNPSLQELESLIVFLHDATATIEIFLSVYQEGCKLFCLGEVISEIIFFYSNVLPEMQIALEDANVPPETSVTCSNLCTFIENIRLDFLRIIKSTFDYMSGSIHKSMDKQDELVDEYLTLMMELLLESSFLYDYNYFYPIDVDLQFVIQNCKNVDTVKVSHILQGVQLLENDESIGKISNISIEEKSSQLINKIDVTSQIKKVKDILPHLDELFIRNSLKKHNYDPETVIMSVLENTEKPNISVMNERREQISNTKTFSKKPVSTKNYSKEYQDWIIGKDTNALEMNSSVLSKWMYAEDDTYDDEYDDTYDESDVGAREGGDADMVRRPFVVPRVLLQVKTARENDESSNIETDDIDDVYNVDDDVGDHDNDDGDDDDDDESDGNKKVCSNAERLRRVHNSKDMGNNRGQDQVKNSRKNFRYKESNKSHIANHNRKRQARKKHNQGMIPF